MSKMFYTVFLLLLLVIIPYSSYSYSNDFLGIQSSDMKSIVESFKNIPDRSFENRIVYICVNTGNSHVCNSIFAKDLEYAKSKAVSYHNSLNDCFLRCVVEKNKNREINQRR